VDRLRLFSDALGYAENSDTGVDELAAMLSAISGFTVKHVRPVYANPENGPNKFQSGSLILAATQQGILPGDESGYGLYEMEINAAGRLMSSGMLYCLGAENASLAWDFHQYALARWLSRQLNLPVVHPLAIVMGRSDLARYALVRWLADGSPGPEDTALLEEFFFNAATDPDLTTIHNCGYAWENAIFPVFENGKLYWRQYSREDLLVREEQDAHGLEDIPLISIGIKKGVMPLHEFTDPLQSKMIYRAAWSITNRALLSIGAGIAGAAVKKAREYAGQRFQGGCLIQDHPAVKSLLSGSSAKVSVVMNSVLQESIRDDWRSSAASRLISQDLLQQAVTDSLQVFGGYGYMKDFGMEKKLRDIQHLRQLCGSVRALEQFCSVL
jgi:hypothetical protein